MIFQFIARLGLDVVDFVAGVKKATSATDKMKSDMQSSGTVISRSFAGIGKTIAGAFTVGAITAFASKITDTVGQIKDVSELLGTSYEETQRLEHAAKSAGMSFETVVKAMQQVEAHKVKAMAGDKSSGALFSILGVDPSNSTLDVLRRTVEASKRGVNENAAAVDLLGSKVGNLKMLVKELNEQPKISLISKEEIDAIDAADKAASNALANAWRATVSGSGRAVQRFQRAGMLFEAADMAEVFAEGTGLQGKERQDARRAFTLDIYKRLNEQAGFSVGASSASIAKPSSQSDQDKTLEALTRLQVEAKRTADALEKATKQ